MRKQVPRSPFTQTATNVCLMTALLFCSAGSILAQTAQSSPTPPQLDDAKDFRPLFEERETLIDELKKLELTIEKLTAQLRDLPPREQLDKELTRLNRELEKEQKAAKPDDAKISSLKSYIDATNEKLEMAKHSADLQSSIDQRDQKRRRLSQAERKIASLFDDKRDVSWFRAISAIVVGVLIAIVVGGFYLIAWRKDGIAAKIFGGEMGMQFVTLFLIVIAIILFGIMGTLEGRELAALLGGLSGYILGKASAKTDAAANPTSQGQGQQQQNQNQP